MRHTLIPTDLKKALRHEYRVRATIVFLFMISIAWVIGIVSLLPSFIHVKTEKDTINKSLATLQGSPIKKGVIDVGNDIAKQSDMLALFNKQTGGMTSNSSIITSIVGARGNVKLTSLAISRTATTSILVIIQGVAPTRDALINFKNLLSSSVPGNKVDLPISELAMSKDIHFSITMTNDKTP